MDIKVLAEQFYDYSLSIRGYSPATIRRYRYVINAFCKFTGINDLHDVTDEKVQQLFFMGRAKRKWSTQTYAVYRLSLLVFFRWCVKNSFMKHNSVEDIEAPKIEKKLPPKLRKQEALRLLDVVYHYPWTQQFLRYRNHAIFALFVFAGLRKQELLHLKLADVDIENFTIFVRQGKGRKDRVVPISFTLAQILKRYVTERKRLTRTCPEFFVSSNRNMGITENGLKHLVRLLNNVSGITFTIHKLRHTFATLMLEGGCDIYSLSRMMGHSDIKTTTIYLSASAEHLRSQITKHPLNNLPSNYPI